MGIAVRKESMQSCQNHVVLKYPENDGPYSNWDPKMDHKFDNLSHDFDN